MRTWKREPLWKPVRAALPLLLSCTLGGAAAAQPGAPGAASEGLSARSDAQRVLYFPEWLSPERSRGWQSEGVSVAQLREEDLPLPSSFRERDEAVLGYDTPVRLGASDLLLKLRAPGRRRSIVTFEVIF